MVGLALESYGFWLLFCEFFPTVLQFLRRVPYLGKMLDLPFLKRVSARRHTAHTAHLHTTRNNATCAPRHACLPLTWPPSLSPPCPPQFFNRLAAKGGLPQTVYQADGKR